MRKDIYDAWLTNLASGEYKRAKSALGRKNIYGENRYCCIGVLGCTLKKQFPEVLNAVGLDFFGIEEKPEIYSGAFFLDRTDGDIDTNTLPPQIACELKLERNSLSMFMYTNDASWLGDDYGPVISIIKEECEDTLTE